MIPALFFTAAVLMAAFPAQGRPIAAPSLGPPPGVLPAGVYSAPPLARLSTGAILWSSGQLASGAGGYQVEAADARYTTVAKWRDGLLACGIKERRQGYFSGDTGRRSCVLHGMRSRRQVFTARRGGRRPFDDIAVHGDTLIALSGEEMLAIDLARGRIVSTADINGPLWSRVLALAVRSRAERSRADQRTGVGALLRTPGGLVHARLVQREGGWEVISRRVTWTGKSVAFGPASATQVAASVQPIAHGLRLVSGGLDGRRFLVGGARPSAGPNRADRFALVELAGFPAMAAPRWSGEGATGGMTDLAAASEDGLVGLGGSGLRTVTLIDLRASAPERRTYPLPRPACAISRRPGQPPLANATFITGAQGLEVVAQWSGRDLPRCWRTDRAARLQRSD